MSLIRIWLLASAVLFGGAFLYEFAPLVLVLLAIAAGLGIVSALIVSAARRVEARRRTHRDS